LRLQQCGVQRAVQADRGDTGRGRPRQAAWRGPEDAGDRCGRRLPVPAAMAHGHQQEAEGRLEGSPAIRERFFGLVLGIGPVTPVESD
ncbi:hypothetical protein FE62_15445, partial [Staphylococcus aureus]